MNKQAGRRWQPRRKGLIAAADAGLIVLALAVVEWIRQGTAGVGSLVPDLRELLSRSCFIVAAAAFFLLFGLDRQLWRYASIPQYFRLAMAATAVTGLLPLFDCFGSGLRPPAFYIVFWMILLLLLCACRLVCRLRSGQRKTSHEQSQMPAIGHNSQTDPDKRGIRVMIIGAGYAASQVIRELAETESRYKPVVLIDDDPDLQSLCIRQVAVVGNWHQIRPAVASYRIDEIILALPDASRRQISELLEISRQTGCGLKMLPAISDLISGRVSVSAVRRVTVSDLLGRQDATPLPDTACLTGAVVLVTGGGGSIGAELCRLIAGAKPRRLIVFDFYENNAYELQQELLTRFDGSLDLIVRIGTVCDPERLEEIICRYQPDIIFHTAACKQAPLMQANPGEAVRTNLFGTIQTALTAGRHRVGRFILISTVRAAEPAGVMDATMRLAEIAVRRLADRFPATSLAVVRLSSVLDSHGSVVPLFQRQIRTTRRVTVTHPESRRSFITLRDAACLTLETAARAVSGDIFVHSRQQPIRIADLAEDLIRLSGFEPGPDITIEYTGPRPGETIGEPGGPPQPAVASSPGNDRLTLVRVPATPGDAAEIDRLERQIGWTSHALRRQLDWLRKSVAQASADQLRAAPAEPLSGQTTPASLSGQTTQTELLSGQTTQAEPLSGQTTQAEPLSGEMTPASLSDIKPVSLSEAKQAQPVQLANPEVV